MTVLSGLTCHINAWKGKLSVPDMPKAVLLLLLQFIYTDTLAKNEPTVIYVRVLVFMLASCYLCQDQYRACSCLQASLLQFAALYCLSRLVELCELELRSAS